MAQRILTESGLLEAELSILFVNDLQIQLLNQRYLRRDKPTNVLAFPMRMGEFPTLHSQLLGDIVISVETAQRQSNRFGLDEMGMIILLMIHGVLHLAGYDHEGTGAQARKMATRQKELFQRVMQEASSPFP